MPYTSQSSEFWGWYLRRNSRLVWKRFADAGLDLFATGTGNSTQSFLQLDNVLPAVNEGLNRRWGVSTYVANTGVTFGGNQPARTFFYSQPQDASDPSNTANTNAWIITDNQNMYTYSDAGTVFSGASHPSNFAAMGDVEATVSRSYFYYCNGLQAPRKCNLSYTTANTDSLMGIAEPYAGSGTNYLSYATALMHTSNLIGQTVFPLSTGYGYTSISCTVSDVAGGSGTGGAVSLSLGTHGEVVGYAITPGSNYTQAFATIPAPPSGGTQAYLVLYTQTNASAPNAGKIVGADFGGPMSFASGRKYAVAVRNSKTGHTSDVFMQGVETSGKTGSFLDALTGTINTAQSTSASTIPVFTASTGMQAGVTQIELVISVPATNLDPQVDTVVLLASPDGQELTTLYEVATLPLSGFTLVSGFYQKYYVDTTPDTYGDNYISGPTLLGADIWSETDSSGNVAGIVGNQPPPTTCKYFTVHQGRIFATDGKTVFFSKSLDEVTTSTGLITSKWEEAWPGDYQLPVALNNETVNSIKSDGVSLHLGTEKSIFTLTGSDPDTFSIPSIAFSQTGVISNDMWTVVYSEGIPAGFIWMTPDYKIIYSDFSTYKEIGARIYPLLQTANSAVSTTGKIWSMTQGPYNFVIVQVRLGSNPQPDLFIWETRLQQWYHWILPPPPSGVLTLINPITFVYQFNAFTSSPTKTSGQRFLFYVEAYHSGGVSGPNTIQFNYFDPTQSIDLGSQTIPWSVRTSWQDCEDSTAIKVVNEIEITGDDAPYSVSLYGASQQNQFDSGGVLLATGQTIPGPLSALNTYKFYTAGANTAAKYYSVQIGSSNATTTIPVLSSFSMETYPMARI